MWLNVLAWLGACVWRPLCVCLHPAIAVRVVAYHARHKGGNETNTLYLPMACFWVLVLTLRPPPSSPTRITLLPPCCCRATTTQWMLWRLAASS